jgi:hypothetical protein
MNFNLSIESPLPTSGDGSFISGVALNATAQSRATPTQGTSGGGLFGGCMLAVISDHELESKYCGGRIGAAGIKMCIKEKHRCKVLSNATKAEFVPQIESSSGEYVLIGVSRTLEQVYLSDIVPLESFKADLKTYLYESRSLDEWDHLFSTIKAGTLNREEIVLVANEASAVAIERQINGRV